MAIINNNVQNVKFLRNGSVFTPSGNKTAREVALAEMNGQLDNLADGTAILGRYQESNGIVKTLVGFAYVSGDTKTLTVFDVEGAKADVEALRQEINAKLGGGVTSANTATAQLAALSGNGQSTSAETSVEGAKRYADELKNQMDYSGVTTGTGVYVTNVTESDGIVSATTAILPDASSVADENKVVTDVTQSKGAITATAANITGVKLAGYAEGTDADIAATDTLGEALGKLQAQINAMDLTVISGDGEVITAVSEEDGKVAASKTAIKDVKLTGYIKDTTKTGNIAATDDIEDALSKLENKAAAITIANADGSINVTTAATGTDINVNIKSDEHVLAKDGNAGLYTDIKLSAVTPSSTAVKEEYSLIGTDGSVLGTNIKIYKDSSLYRAYLGHVDDTITSADDPTVVPGTGDTALCFIYYTVNGKYELVAVNVEEFIEENEFASGVTWDSTAHKVKGVVDSTSETFLTVGAGGFKLAGVQNAIDTAISGLDASVSASTTHVTVKVDEVDGKLTAVTLTESDIANKTDLDTLSGKTVTAVDMTGGTAAIAANSTDGTKKITINTDGSQILMTGYAKGSDSGAVATGDSINVAIGKLENQIAGKVDALDATVSGQTTDGKVKVQVVQENGVLTDVTVTGTDIASADALAAEIAARKAVDGQSGQTYAKNTSSTFISGATDLNDADVKLDAALKALSDRTVDEVKVNGKTLDETNNGVDIHISPIAGTDAASTPIVINTANNGDVTIQLEGLDCGTY